MGGGLDLKLTRHLALRLIDADYLLTLLPNGINSRQNNVSLSTGVVFRLGTLTYHLARPLVSSGELVDGVARN